MTHERMLDRHHPFPAFVFDADWIMRRINPAGQWLCSVLMPEVWAATPDKQAGLDMIAGLVHPDGLLSQLRDPAPTGFTLARQLRVEQLTNRTLGLRIDVLEQSLHERFGAPQGEASYPTEDHRPLCFDTRHGPLSFFAVQSVIGIPQDITVGSLRAELWFADDERTRAAVVEHATTLEAPARRSA